MGGEDGNIEVVNRAARTCFLLIEPHSQCNSGEIAKRLALGKGVREVHLTTGRYGFVVAAKIKSESEVNGMRMAAKRIVKDGNVSVAVSHIVYR